MTVFAYYPLPQSATIDLELRRIAKGAGGEEVKAEADRFNMAFEFRFPEKAGADTFLLVAIMNHHLERVRFADTQDAER